MLFLTKRINPQLEKKLFFKYIVLIL